MELHETRWMIDGSPVLGTYAGGADKLEDLRHIRDVGMNVVLAGEVELDPKTPAGAFCLDNGIKVMHHLTQFLYHGVRLRDGCYTSIAQIKRHSFDDSGRKSGTAGCWAPSSPPSANREQGYRGRTMVGRIDEAMKGGQL